MNPAVVIEGDNHGTINLILQAAPRPLRAHQPRRLFGVDPLLAPGGEVAFCNIDGSVFHATHLGQGRFRTNDGTYSTMSAWYRACHSKVPWKRNDVRNADRHISLFVNLGRPAVRLSALRTLY